MKIDFFVFHGSRKTLYERILGDPAFAIHGDFDCFQTFNVSLTVVLGLQYNGITVAFF